MTSAIRCTAAVLAALALGPLAVARAQAPVTQGAAGEHIATAADSTGIREAAMDYIQGWYEGNADRMQRALHPELAKRIVRTDPKTGRSNLGTMGALTLITSTRMGGRGRRGLGRLPPARQVERAVGHRQRALGAPSAVAVTAAGQALRFAALRVFFFNLPGRVLP